MLLIWKQSLAGLGVLVHSYRSFIPVVLIRYPGDHSYVLSLV